MGCLYDVIVKLMFSTARLVKISLFIQKGLACYEEVQRQFYFVLSRQLLSTANACSENFELERLFCKKIDFFFKSQSQTM